MSRVGFAVAAITTVAVALQLVIAGCTSAQAQTAPPGSSIWDQVNSRHACFSSSSGTRLSRAAIGSSAFTKALTHFCCSNDISCVLSEERGYSNYR